MQVNRVVVGIFWAGLVICAVIMLWSGSSAQLGSDDIHWIKGEPSTVYDNYRVLPRLLFRGLHAQTTGSVSAAYAMIFAFHLLNSFLVYHLAGRLLVGQHTPHIAAAVFLINPLTLGTLTWIASFSYVLGATCGLVTLLASWHALTATNWQRRSGCGMIGLVALVCGLLSSHVLLFLPLAFGLIAWIQPQADRSGAALLTVMGLGISAVIYILHYDFVPTEISPAQSLSADFPATYSSSVLALLPMLGVAYILSFLGGDIDFMTSAFKAPLRWALAMLVATAIGAYGWQNRERTRRWLALLALFILLISPYILRLYMLSGFFNYHPSYMLGGRVFYIPFISVAMIIAAFCSQIIQQSTWRLGSLVLAFGLLFATWLVAVEQSNAYQGLTAVAGTPGPKPPTWAAFEESEGIWPLVWGTTAIVWMTLYVVGMRRINTSEVNDGLV
ncbi:MAG: hypothetical protein GYB66_06110 [Chloroflexi bacterium]|nr:hypothetical protein [Chloroflexota bacterium]